MLVRVLRRRREKSGQACVHFRRRIRLAIGGQKKAGVVDQAAGAATGQTRLPVAKGQPLRIARQPVLACLRDQFGQIILVRSSFRDGREQQPRGYTDRQPPQPPPAS